MADYSRQNDFSAKDALSSGDASKLIKGSEVDAEFDAIVTSIATKATVEKGADISSANSITVGTDGNYFDITGTTQINGLVVAANRHFFLQFDGALVLQHNSSDLDLPGEANITTAAGDVAEFFSTATNDAQCVNYTRANGMSASNGKKGSDISSANTMVIGADGNYFDITGTTQINTMTVAANRHFWLQFDGALILQHHSTNLDLPSAANVTTAAGDVAEFFSTAANQVHCVNYTRATGKSLVGGGKVLQVVLGDTTTTVDVNSDTLTDTTLTASITCAATSSKVLVLVSQSVDHNGRSIGQLVIKRTVSGGATTTIFDAINFGDDDNVRAYHAVYALDSPSTTTALTYKTQMARHDQSGTLNIQRSDGSDSGKSTIVLLEIGA